MVLTYRKPVYAHVHQSGGNVTTESRCVVRLLWCDRNVVGKLLGVTCSTFNLMCHVTRIGLIVRSVMKN